MTRIIAVSNQKGGVGKTTSAVNIACGLARALGPRNVLLIDVDPQANATQVLLGVQRSAGPRQMGVPTVKEVILGDVKPLEAIESVTLDSVKTNKTTVPESIIDVMPSHLDLATIEPVLTTQFRGEYQLQKAMKGVTKNYKIIVIDCPPSLGALTLNALIFCNEVLIPVDPGEFSLVGLGMLQSTISQATEANPSLRISGVLPNSMQRSRLSRETQEALKANFGKLVLPPIPDRVAIGEAHSSGGDIFSYAPDSDSAAAYAAVIKEVLRNG